MIIHMARGATPEQEKAVLDRISNAGFKCEVIHGSTGIDVIGILGDLSGIEESFFSEIEGVDQVVRISRPYKLVSRQYSSESKKIRVGDIEIGGDELAIMAGPCSLETEEQVMTIARYVAELGIRIMRGGAYKPRTSPYSFQGMGIEGLKLLAKARDAFGLKIITEATGLHRHIGPDGSQERNTVLENVIEYSDIIQVGARNMKSYGFLQELAVLTKESKKPILLKRGESSTLKDFLLAAEYIVSAGNPNVILCLRGIRAFEESEFQRYTSDIAAVSVLKSESNLPVIFDPSHAIGNRHYVEGVAMAAVAAGADGLLIETHNDPANALCDGDQSITRDELKRLKDRVFRIRTAMEPDR